MVYEDSGLKSLWCVTVWPIPCKNGWFQAPCWCCNPSGMGWEGKTTADSNGSSKATNDRYHPKSSWGQITESCWIDKVYTHTVYCILYTAYCILTVLFRNREIIAIAARASPDRPTQLPSGLLTPSKSLDGKRRMLLSPSAIRCWNGTTRSSKRFGK